MFCIAAFIVFAILAIFSARYRPLAAKAWHCVVRRVTLRPCDITFSQEMKGVIVGKYVLTHPRFARFLDRWIDWISFAFVILSIWSAWYVLVAGLNLWVYDTCNPTNVESCSLSGEACGIDQSKVTFIEAVRTGDIAGWATGPFVRFGQTVARIPDRLQTWDPQEFTGPTATYFYTPDPAKPYALEVMDPLCKFCRQLYKNIRETRFEERYNLTYLLYPIPDEHAESGYKFAHSPLIAAYIEAIKLVPLEQAGSTPADWQFIDLLFGERADGTDWQTAINLGMTRDQVLQTLDQFAATIGYTPEQRARIAQVAQSQEVADSLAQQAQIVEKDLRTIKIPTIVFDGRRYDRAVGTDILQAD